MKVVESFYKQQMGFSRWRNYDSSLERLRCLKDEEYKGIWDANSADHENCDTPVFACKFAEKSGCEHLIGLANEDGRLLIRDTTHKENSFFSRIHQNAIFDIAWLCDSLKVITVSGDHTARLVDVSSDSMRVEQVFTGHNRSVKTVASRINDSSVFATGSRDGSIRVWDIRSVQTANLIGHSDRTITNSHCKTPSSTVKKKNLLSTNSVSAANSVTGLVFQDENTLISCGSGDGLIKIWDLRKTYTSTREPLAKHEIPYTGHTTRNGFSNLTIDPNSLKLYANCLDNTIYCYNMASYDVTPVVEFRGHQNTTFYVKSVISPDGNYLLSGSSDHNAYIWNIKNPVPLIKLAGHAAEVTCVAWCKIGDLALVTCSDDVRHKIWRIGNETLPDNWEIEGRGQAEQVHTPGRIKRFLEVNENTPMQVKRFKSAETNKRQADGDAGGSSAKRFNSGRRLFDLTNNPSCSNIEEENLASVISEDDDFKTPTNKKRRLMEVTPPDAFSPTTNLPNFVVDGVAPHLHFSPQKRVDKDWLTKMRVEKKLIRDMQELAAGGSSPHRHLSTKLDERSPRSRVQKRRNSRCGSQSPILRFFRVTNNSIMNGQCSPKSSRTQHTCPGQTDSNN